MGLSVPRTNVPLIRHRMSDEQRAGYTLAMKCGAKKTAAKIRANKASMGAAIVNASKEIGTEHVIQALVDAENPWWALCAIRYAPHIQWWHRGRLSMLLMHEQYEHVKWVLRNFHHLSKEEAQVLRWITQLPH